MTRQRKRLYVGLIGIGSIVLLGDLVLDRAQTGAQIVVRRRNPSGGSIRRARAGVIGNNA